MASSTLASGPEGRSLRRIAADYGAMLWRDKPALVAVGFLVLMIVFVVAGSALLGPNAGRQNLSARMLPPFDLSRGFSYALGSDPLGRSLLERLILAGQTSLTLSTSAAVLAALLGGATGLAAGYAGGWLDTVAMRLADVILSFPSLLLAILFLYLLEPSAANIVLLLVIGRLPLYLRVTRAEALEVRKRLFVDAARLLGASPLRLCVQEIAPIIVPTVLTLIALDIGLLMLLESALSFLGLGLQSPAISWGTMVSDGRRWLNTAWWLSFFPGLLIFLTALTSNMLSNWLRLAMDPVQRWRLEIDSSPAIALKAAPTSGVTVDMAPAALAVQGLQVEFHTRRGVVRAVRGLNLTLRRGETLAIIGESGSGKSVTARAILGILPSPPAFVTGGSIRLGGRDMLKMSHAERRSVQGDRVAMVFQDALAALNPVFTIGWHIAELLRIHRGLPFQRGYARAVELLRDVGIPNPEQRVNEYAHQFSGGMRQRAMIALAIALEPDVLLADEPTTALDVTVQAQIMQLLAKLRREKGMALALITHDIAVASEVADRIVVMYAGRVVESGSVRDILVQPRHPYTRALVALARNETARGRAPIQGTPPDMAAVAPGCAFAPRCPMAAERCRSEDPALRAVGAAQMSACHFAERVGADG
jgi:peptide/nickel transport system permease protein